MQKFVTVLWFHKLLQFPPFYPRKHDCEAGARSGRGQRLRLSGSFTMAAPPATPADLPTASPFLPPSCGQCLVAILVLGTLTAVFMVVCLSLSFKLSLRSRQSRRCTDMVTSVPLELWAAPPTSHSQTNLLCPTGPVPPAPPPSNDWGDDLFRQPRVTLQDIDEFWWRNFRDV